MELGLHGRTALVTGGSKGIGLACAQALAAEGVRVAIVSRSRANIDAALGLLPGAVGITADLADAAAAADALRSTIDTLGPLDILVNSAGAAARYAPDELTPERWRAAFDAKFFSYVNIMDPAVKQMAARGSGVIVNIIGQGGKVATPTHLSGGAANAALMLATAGLGAAYARRGVRVVGINPGRVETGRVTAGFEIEARIANQSIDAVRHAATAEIPMGRLAQPDDIAKLTVFLASDAAAYLTGINISVDGASNPVIF